MDTLSLAELKSLIGYPGPLCVSLYMPTQRGGTAAFQNPVRLRSLLQKAEKELTQRHLDEAGIQDLLQPVYSLADEDYFWAHPGDGLALFLAPGFVRRYNLPLAFEETVAVGPRFQIRPLLPLLSGDGQFYLLTLSQNAVRLLKGTRDTIQEVHLEGVPQSLGEALQYEEPQAHQNVNYNAGRPFPGSNEPKEDRKEKIRRFFHLVDKNLQKWIRNGPVPLVLAGVQYELAIYRQVNTYPHLLEEGMEANPEHYSIRELHTQAWRIVEPYFQQAEQKILAQYAEYACKGLASGDIREIVPATVSGRVASLVVAKEPNQWGHFDTGANRVVLHRQPGKGDEDLINFAATETLLHGGRVYIEAQDSMPDATSLAATFRY